MERNEEVIECVNASDCMISFLNFFWVVLMKNIFVQLLLLGFYVWRIETIVFRYVRVCGKSIESETFVSGVLSIVSKIFLYLFQVHLAPAEWNAHNYFDISSIIAYMACISFLFLIVSENGRQCYFCFEGQGG